MMDAKEFEEHLFRREAGRLDSILTGLFGMHNLALAEDVVQDAFCRALEMWKFHGVPKNPSAWLLTTARNRALDVLRRKRTALRYAPDLEQYLKSEWTLKPTVDDAFDAGGIKDVQLRMMFSCIHPELPEETQLALILHLLCGFGMEETAAAFLKKGDALWEALCPCARPLHLPQRSSPPPPCPESVRLTYLWPLLRKVQTGLVQLRISGLMMALGTISYDDLEQ